MQYFLLSIHKSQKGLCSAYYAGFFIQIVTFTHKCKYTSITSHISTEDI